MEQYYRICIDPLPEIHFSNMNSTANYRWTIRGKKPCGLEINYIIIGSLRCTGKDRQEHIGRGSVFSVLHDSPLEMVSDDPLYQEISCGLVLPRPGRLIHADEVADLQYESSEAIIPLTITDPVIAQQTYNLLTAIGTHCRDAADPVRRLMLRSRICELLALLTRYSLRQAKRQQPLPGQEQEARCRRACLYIREHLAEPIRSETLAAAVGISYRRLSDLFQLHMGMTPVEYINTEKIQRVKQLLLFEGASLKTAGEAVGIKNTDYLSTLFRKYTGVTAREFRKVRKRSVLRPTIRR